VSLLQQRNTRTCSWEASARAQSAWHSMRALLLDLLPAIAYIPCCVLSCV
jgi:hypothetical protein